MIAVQSYLYDNVVQVQILDTAIFKTRNRVVYNRTIKIYQGIDNTILVQVKNQDQKSANLVGRSVLVDLLDPTNDFLLVSYPLTWVDDSKGTGSFIINKSEVNMLDQRYYKITLKLVDNDSGNERPLYSDDNYSIGIDVQVLPGYQSNNSSVLSLDGGNAGNTYTIAPPFNGGGA